MNGDYGQMTGNETAYTVLNNTTCQQDIIINQVNNKECLGILLGCFGGQKIGLSKPQK